MANTTFNGPVRSENGFKVVSKNASTGAFTDVVDIASTGIVTNKYVKHAGFATGVTVNTTAGDRPPKHTQHCLLYTSPSPRDGLLSRMPSSA